MRISGRPRQRHSTKWIVAGRFFIRGIFRWYDAWVGVYLDAQHGHCYVFPMPFLGVEIRWF